MTVSTGQLPVVLTLVGVGLAIAPPIRPAWRGADADSGGDGDSAGGGGRSAGRSGRPSMSKRTLQLIAAVGLGCACVLALGQPAGVIAAALSVPLSWVCVARLHARPARPPGGAALALTLDLVAAALRCGQPLSAALVLSAPAADPVSAALLMRVGGLLRLGADPSDAWSAVGGHPSLEPIAATARRSADSGIRLAGAFDQLAAELRATSVAAAEARAQRTGVFAVAPLGLCFLPAFVCLGIVPVVVGIAGQVFTSLR